MPKSAIIRTNEHPYHVSSRCLHGEIFPHELEEVWSILIRFLSRVTRTRKLSIHAFVLMSNHFHLLCETPEMNLDQVMQVFLKESSHLILKKSHAKNLWEPRYRWTLIQNHHHYQQVYRYIYQNPLRAGIVTRVEDYPYSTLRDVPFPLHVPIQYGGLEGEKLWLNEPMNAEDRSLIRLGLRKTIFDVNQRKKLGGLDLPVRY